MNYFVNENIFTFNSGTEFSAVERVKLFQKNNVEAKILTRNYNSQLSYDIGRVGLTRDDIINMYDYFQDVVSVPEEKDEVLRYSKIVDRELYHIEGIDANSSWIRRHGNAVAKAKIAPGTIGYVGSVEFINAFGGAVAEDIWDRRGFKSSTQYFHPDGTMGAQVFFDYNGKPKIEITHMNVNNQLYPTMYKLLDYNGKRYRFNTEEELFVFFMSELASQEESVFINDRPSLIPAVAKIKGAVGKWHMLHSTHTNRAHRSGKQIEPVSFLEPLFSTYREDYDGIIVPTKKQKRDIEKYYEFKHVLALPDAYATEIEKEVDVKERNFNKILYLGRMSDDKNPDAGIEIMQYLRKKLPEAVLEYYGYATPPTIQERLNTLVEQHSLEKNVVFANYQDAEKIYEGLDEATLVISAGLDEAFGMNILEALSHGVPVVAFDTPYGVREQIENGVNGIVAQQGTYKTTSDNIAKLLSDKTAWGKMSKAAYAKSEEFSAEKAWGLWSSIRQVVPNLYVK